MKEAIIFKFHRGELFIFPADDKVLERRKKFVSCNRRALAEMLLHDNLAVLFDYASGEALRLGVDNFDDLLSTICELCFPADKAAAKALDKWLMDCFWQGQQYDEPHVIKLEVPQVELLPDYRFNRKRGKAKRPRENYIRVPHKTGRLNSKPKGPRFY